MTGKATYTPFTTTDGREGVLYQNKDFFAEYLRLRRTHILAELRFIEDFLDLPSSIITARERRRLKRVGDNE